MIRQLRLLILALPLICVQAHAQSEDPATGRSQWEACFQRPAAWYGSAEAVRIADNVLLFQRSTGGWPKNVDLVRIYSTAEQDSIRRLRDAPGTTIDNGATHSQLRFLTMVHAKTRIPRFAEGIRRGLEYLLAAQYPNGGWPQFYPLVAGYYTHITFNDDAMVGVLNLFYDLVHGTEKSSAVDGAMRERLREAMEKGVQCILRCQVRVNGERTVWCAQHDEVTLEPAGARTYELPALSGKESVGIVRFLMRFDHPRPELVAAIQGAVKWFVRSRLKGIRVVEEPDSTVPHGWNRIVVHDSAAPPLWGRFYDLETNQVFFCSRDGVKRASLAEISSERRNHYGWLGDWPRTLLENEYPRWQQRWAPNENVLLAKDPTR